MICYSCFQESEGEPRFCTNCGRPMAQDWEKFPHALPYGTVLGGRYISGRVLGQGGFGVTYAAQEYKTKRMVAIKEFFPDSMAARGEGNSVVPYTGQRGEDFQYGKSMFLEEAKTLAQFNNEPGIVQVYSYFEEYGTAYFAMEYVQGVSLQQYIDEHGGRLGWEELKRLMLPVMDSMSKVHARGIIHRDLKPDNIFIDGDGQVKVLDFGSARYSMGEKSRSLDVVLTHGFAPREQYSRHGRQGKYTDVYALAATMYYALTGRKPPDSIDRIDEDTLAMPSALGAQIPRAEEDALIKALSVEPQDRYPTMEAFKQALTEQSTPAQPQNTWQQPQPVQQPPQPVQQPPQPAQPQNTWQQPQPVQQPPQPAQPQNTWQQPQPVQQPPQPAQPQNTWQQPQPGPAPGYAPPVRKKKKGWVIPVAAVAAVALIVGGVLAVRGRSGTRSETQSETIPAATAAPAVLSTESPAATEEPKENSGGWSGGGEQNSVSPTPGLESPVASEGVAGYYAITSMTVNDTTVEGQTLAESGVVDTTYVILREDRSGVISLDGDETEFQLEGDNMVAEGETVPCTLENGVLTLMIDDGEDHMVIRFTRRADAMPESTPQYTLNTGAGNSAATASGQCGANVSWYLADGTLYLEGSGAMTDFVYEEDIPWKDYWADISFVSVGEGITTVGDGAFYCCEMEGVRLPESLTSVGGFAFSECSRLSAVTIPAAVSFLGDGAFWDCESLAEVRVESRSVELDEDVFTFCPALKSLSFAGSIRGVGHDAFYDDTMTVYYPEDDSSWWSIVGNNYGGEPRWVPAGGSSPSVVERISSQSGKYSIAMPSTWAGCYGYITDGDYLGVYELASNEAGDGGRVFTLGLYSDRAYEDLPSYEAVGKLSGPEGSYTVVAIYPTDVQFSAGRQQAYMELYNDVWSVFRYLGGENGYQFTFE